MAGGAGVIAEADLRKWCDAAGDYTDALNHACARWDITSNQRLRQFLAQLAHESAGFTRLEENLNYSAEALRAKFSRERISESMCDLYGRSPKHPADREAIANAIYGGEWGRKHLGNTEPGDGWAFRGKGLIQITGRDNTRRCSRALFDDERLLHHPELLLEPEGAAQSAGWFWYNHDLNRKADADDLEGITRVINGGLLGLEDRRDCLTRAVEVWP